MQFALNVGECRISCALRPLKSSGVVSASFLISLQLMIFLLYEPVLHILCVENAT